jgi:hypothetical protein
MKLGLQIGLGVLSLIPLFFAITGVMNGAAAFMPDGGYPAAIDNQLRYLSAIYLLVTLLVWWIIPNVEKHGLILAFVCGVLVLGGLARFVSYTIIGPGLDRQFVGMVLELSSPVFLIWQRLVARKATDA